MTDTQLRVGIIGLGKMGLVHAAAIRTHPRVNLVAACDTSKFMTSTLSRYLTGMAFHDSHDRMLATENLDAVFITTPTGSHAPLALDCARAGLHVFVEKPMATNLAEAEELERELAAKGLRSQVGYVCRYAPTFEKAKEILDSGALGRILGFGSVKYSSDVQKRAENSWRFIRKPSGGGGGVVNEFACHGVDLLVWLFGEPGDVGARMESWYSDQVEDYVHATFDYGDFSGWIDSSWSMQDYRKPYNRIDITGENGRLTVTDSELRWMLHEPHGEYTAGWHSTNVTELYKPVRMFVGDIMFTRQADSFIDSATGGAPSRSPATEALRTQRVLEAIHREGSR